MVDGDNPISYTLAGDLSGAASAAVVNLLQSIGYGLIAFSVLGPEYIGIGASLGLISAVVGCLVTAAFGGTRVIISGPLAPTTLVVAALVISLSSSSGTFSYQTGNPGLAATTIIALVSLSTLVSALLQMLIGAFKLGGVVKFVPYSVISGFMNGVALLVIFGQVSPLLGVPDTTTVMDVVTDPQIIQPMTVLVGLASLASIYLTRRFINWIPGALAGVVVGTALYHFLAQHVPASELGPVLESPNVSFSAITDGIARWNGFADVPGFSTMLPTLIVAGLVLGLISSMETLMTSVMADNFLGKRHDSNRDLLGQGLGNLCCGIVGALPTGGSMSRTQVNYLSGGRTRFSGIASGLLVLAIVLLFDDAIALVPLSVIAGLLVSIGIDLFDNWTKSLLRKLRTHATQRRPVLVYLGVATLVALLAVIVNIVVAVGVGIACASLIFMARMGRSVVRRKYSGDQVHSRKIRSHGQQERVQRHASTIMTYELQGPIFFGSADRLAYEIERESDRIRYVVFDLLRVVCADPNLRLFAAVLFKV